MRCSQLFFLPQASSAVQVRTSTPVPLQPVKPDVLSL
jgi:hypothetical protein